MDQIGWKDNKERCILDGINRHSRKYKWHNNNINGQADSQTNDTIDVIGRQGK